MAEPSHIVVVDDEPEICEMLADYLSHAGFAVSTAEGGAAMRRILEERPGRPRDPRHQHAGRGRPLARPLPARQRQGRHHHADRGGRGRRPHRRVSRWAPTTTSPSRSTCASCSPGCARCCAACRPERRRPARPGRAARPTRSASAPASSISTPTSSTTADGEEVAITSMEFDLLKAFAEHPEPGAEPRSAARSGAQQGLGAVRPLDRHPDRPPAPQDRGRSRPSPR